MVDLELVRTLPVFAHCTPAEHERLAFSALKRELTAGEVLFRAREAREDFFVLLSGDIQIASEFYGREQTVVVYHPEAFIGLQALLDEPSVHTNSATVLSPTASVLQWTRAVLRSIAHEHPEVLSNIVLTAAASLEERLQYANRKLFAFYTVARILRRSGSVRAVGAEILSVAAHSTHASKGLFLLIDPLRGMLTPMAILGFENTSAMNTWVGRYERDAYVGLVHRQRQPLIIARERAVAHVPPYWTGSMLLVPLIVAARSVGVLLLADRTHGRPFAQNSEMMLEAIAQQLADAFERGRLTQQQQAARDLHRVYVGPYSSNG